MNDRQLMKKMRELSAEQPPIRADEKERVIAAVLQHDIPIRKRAGFAEFVLTQIRFLDRLVLVWQALWLVLFVFALENGHLLYIENEAMCILSISPPILLLLSVEQISRIYSRSMLEIEYATKYSLKTAVMGRMLLLGAINGIVLISAVILAGSMTDLRAGTLVVYGFTPFVVFTFLLLFLMKSRNGEQLMYAGIAGYLLLLVLILFGRNEYVNVFDPAYEWIWLAFLAAGVIGTVYEGKKLGRVLENFEHMTA